MNSKPTRTRLIAISTESVPSSQGRIAQPGPNGSAPAPRNVCHQQTAKRRCSRIDLPSTLSSAL